MSEIGRYNKKKYEELRDRLLDALNKYKEGKKEIQAILKEAREAYQRKEITRGEYYSLKGLVDTTLWKERWL